MSEYQMREIIEELRGLHKDITRNLECIALCMVLNVITNNGTRDITAQERSELLKVLNGEEDVDPMLCKYLMHAPRPRSCKGDKK